MLIYLVIAGICFSVGIAITFLIANNIIEIQDIDEDDPFPGIFISFFASLIWPITFLAGIIYFLIKYVAKIVEKRTEDKF